MRFDRLFVLGLIPTLFLAIQAFGVTPDFRFQRVIDDDVNAWLPGNPPSPGTSQSNFTPNGDGNADAMVFVYSVTNPAFISGGDWELIIDLDRDGTFETNGDDWARTGNVWSHQTNLEVWRGTRNPDGTGMSVPDWVVANGPYDVRMRIDDLQNGRIDSLVSVRQTIAAPYTAVLSGIMSITGVTNKSQVSLNGSGQMIYSAPVGNGQRYTVYGLQAGYYDGWNLKAENPGLPSVGGEMILGPLSGNDIDLTSGTNNIAIAMTARGATRLQGHFYDYLTGESVDGVPVNLDPYDESATAREYATSDLSGFYTMNIRGTFDYRYSVGDSMNSSSLYGSQYGDLTISSNIHPVVRDFFLGPKSGLTVDIGRPVGGVWVYIGANGNGMSTSVSTATDGRAAASGSFSGGTYRVQVVSYSNPANGNLYAGIVTNVSVADGQFRTVTLLAPQAFAVYGTIRTNGSPVKDVDVGIYRNGTRVETMSGTQSDTSGNYRLSEALVPGTYTVQAEPGGIPFAFNPQSVTLTTSNVRRDFNLTKLSNLVTVVWSNWTSVTQGGNPAIAYLIPYRSNPGAGGQAYYSPVTSRTTRVPAGPTSQTCSALVGSMLPSGGGGGGIPNFIETKYGVRAGGTVVFSGNSVHSRLTTVFVETNTWIPANFNNGGGLFTMTMRTQFIQFSIFQGSTVIQTNLTSAGPYIVSVEEFSGQPVYETKQFKNLSANSTVTLAVVPIDHAPPSIAYLAPASGMKTPSNVLSFYVSDAGSGVATNSVSVQWVGGAGPNFGTKTLGGGLTWSNGIVRLASMGLSAGQQSVRISVSDRAKSVNTTVLTDVFTIDMTKPMVTRLTFTDTAGTGDSVFGWEGPFHLTLSLATSETGNVKIWMDNNTNAVFDPGVDAWLSLNNTRFKNCVYTNGLNLFMDPGSMGWETGVNGPTGSFQNFYDLSEGPHRVFIELDDSRTASVNDGNKVVTNIVFWKDTQSISLDRAVTLGTNQVLLTFSSFVDRISNVQITGRTVKSTNIAGQNVLLTLTTPLAASNILWLNSIQVWDRGNNPPQFFSRQIDDGIPPSLTVAKTTNFGLLFRFNENVASCAVVVSNHAVLGTNIAGNRVLLTLSPLALRGETPRFWLAAVDLHGNPVLTNGISVDRQRPAVVKFQVIATNKARVYFDETLSAGTASQTNKYRVVSLSNAVRKTNFPNSVDVSGAGLNPALIVLNFNKARFSTNQVWAEVWVTGVNDITGINLVDAVSNTARDTNMYLKPWGPEPGFRLRLSLDDDGMVQYPGNRPSPGTSQSNFSPDANGSDDAMTFEIFVTNPLFVAPGDVEVVIDLDRDGAFEITDWVQTGMIWPGQTNGSVWNGFQKPYSGGNNGDSQYWVVPNGPYNVRVRIDTTWDGAIDSFTSTNYVHAAPYTAVLSGLLTVAGSTNPAQVIVNQRHSAPATNGGRYSVYGLRAQPYASWELTAVCADLPSVTGVMILGTATGSDIDVSGGTNELNISMNRTGATFVQGTVFDYLSGDPLEDIPVNFSPQNQDYFTTSWEGSTSGVWGDYRTPIRGTYTYRYTVGNEWDSSYPYGILNGTIAIDSNVNPVQRDFFVGPRGGLIVSIGEPVGGVNVYVYDAASGSGLGNFNTDPFGVAVSGTGFSAGTVRLQVSAYSNPADGKNYMELRTNVLLVSGATKIVNLTAVPGYRIYGTVRTNGTPLQDVDVKVFRNGLELDMGAQSDSSGDYTFGADILAAGTYSVQAQPAGFVYQTRGVTLTVSNLRVDFDLVKLSNSLTVVWSNWTSVTQSGRTAIAYIIPDRPDMSAGQNFFSPVTSRTTLIPVGPTSQTCSVLVGFMDPSMGGAPVFLETQYGKKAGDVVVFSGASPHSRIGLVFLISNTMAPADFNNGVGIYFFTMRTQFVQFAAQNANSAVFTNLTAPGPYIVSLQEFTGSPVYEPKQFKGLAANSTATLLIVPNDVIPPTVSYILPGSGTKTPLASSVSFDLDDLSGVDPASISLQWVGGSGPDFGTKSVGSGLAWSNGRAVASSLGLSQGPQRVRIAASDGSKRRNTVVLTNGFTVDTVKPVVNVLSFTDTAGTGDSVFGGFEGNFRLRLSLATSETGNLSVWMDVNTNGIFDPSTDLWFTPQWSVRLKNSIYTNGLDLTMTPGELDWSGGPGGANYDFNNLPEGRYAVVVELDDSRSLSVNDGNRVRTNLVFWKDTQSPNLTAARTTGPTTVVLSFDSFIDRIANLAVLGRTVTATNISGTDLVLTISPAVGPTNTLQLTSLDLWDKGDNFRNFGGQTIFDGMAPVLLAAKSTNTGSAVFKFDQNVTFVSAVVSNHVTLSTNVVNRNVTVSVWPEIGRGETPGYSISVRDAANNVASFSGLLGDGLPPAVQRFWVISTNQARVYFNETLDPATAGQTNRYRVVSLSNGVLTTNFPNAVNTAGITGSPSAVLLSWLNTRFSTGQTWAEVWVNGVRDAALNTVDAVSNTARDTAMTLSAYGPEPVFRLRRAIDDDGQVGFGDPPFPGTSQSNFSPDSDYQKDAMVFVFSVSNPLFAGTGDYEVIVDLNRDGAFDANDWVATGNINAGQTNMVVWHGFQKPMNGGWFGDPQYWVVPNGPYQARVRIDDSWDGMIDSFVATNFITAAPTTAVLSGLMTVNGSTNPSRVQVNGHYSAPVVGGERYSVYGLESRFYGSFDLVSLNPGLPSVTGLMIFGTYSGNEIDLNSGTNTLDIVMGPEGATVLQGYVYDFLSGDLLSGVDLNFTPRISDVFSTAWEGSSSDLFGAFRIPIRGTFDYSYSVGNDWDSSFPYGLLRGALNVSSNVMPVLRDFYLSPKSGFIVDIGKPVANVYTGITSDSGNFAGWMQTATNGRGVSTGSFPAGTYRLEISAFTNPADGKWYVSRITNVTVADGQTKLISLNAIQGFRVSGTVTSGVMPLDNVQLQIFLNGNQVENTSADTDPTGQYVFNGCFAAGSYSVQAQPESGYAYQQKPAVITTSNVRLDFDLAPLTNSLTVVWTNWTQYTQAGSMTVAFVLPDRMIFNSSGQAFSTAVTSRTTVVALGPGTGGYTVLVGLMSPAGGAPVFVDSAIGVYEGDTVVIPVAGPRFRLSGRVVETNTLIPAMPNSAGIFVLTVSSQYLGFKALDSVSAFAFTNLLAAGPYLLVPMEFGSSSGFIPKIFTGIPSNSTVTLSLVRPDRTAPDITLLRPGFGVKTPSAATISFLADDGSGKGVDPSSISVQWISGSGPTFGTKTVGSGLSYSAGQVTFTPTGLGPGPQKIRISVSDLANPVNTAVLTNTFTVDTVTPVISVLTFTDTSGTGDNVFGNGEGGFRLRLSLTTSETGNLSVWMDNNLNTLFDPGIDTWFNPAWQKPVRNTVYTNAFDLTVTPWDFGWDSGSWSGDNYYSLSEGRHSVYVEFDDSRTLSVNDGNRVRTNLVFWKDDQPPQIAGLRTGGTNLVVVTLDSNSLPEAVSAIDIRDQFFSPLVVVRTQFVGNAILFTLQNRIAADQGLILNRLDVLDKGDNFSGFLNGPIPDGVKPRLLLARSILTNTLILRFAERVTNLSFASVAGYTVVQAVSFSSNVGITVTPAFQPDAKTNFSVTLSDFAGNITNLSTTFADGLSPRLVKFDVVDTNQAFLQFNEPLSIAGLSSTNLYRVRIVTNGVTNAVFRPGSVNTNGYKQKPSTLTLDFTRKVFNSLQTRAILLVYNISDASFNAVQTNGVNNRAVDTNIAFDVSPPAAPVLVLPPVAGLTNDSTPGFLWNRATDPSGILRYEVGINSTVYNAGNPTNWTYPTAWVDGSSNWRVRAVDNAGNTGAWSAIRGLTVDATAPAAPGIVLPVSGRITNAAIPVFRWNKAGDPSGISFYQVLINATVYSVGASTNWTYPSAWVDGQSNWQVRAVDGAHNQGVLSVVRTLRVDTSAPAAPTLYLPLDGRVTNDSTPSFLWAQAQDVSGIKRFDVRINGVTVYNAGTATNWTYPTTWVDGVSNWQVRAVDNANNAGAWAAARSLRIDTILPTTPVLVLPVNARTTNDSTPDFLWNKSTDTGGLQRYEFRVNNSIFNLGMVTNWSYPTTWVDGSSNWQVRAVDNANNASAWAAARSLIVDATAPAAPVQLLPANGALTNTGTPNFLWQRTADASGIKRYEVRVNLGAPVSAGTATNLVWAALPTGSYLWQVRALDNAGNTGSWSGLIAFTVDITPPSTITPIAPLAGAATNDTTPSFLWPASTDLYGIDQYEIRINNTVYAAGTLTNWTYIPGVCVDGTSNWQVRAIDNAGNPGAWSVVRALLVDSTPPGIPNLLLPAASKVTNAVSPVFRWNKSADAGGILRYEISINATVYSAGNTTNWTYPSTFVDGTSNWQVRAVDLAGNAGSWAGSRALTVDTVLPGIPVLYLPPDSRITNDNTPSFLWGQVPDASGIKRYELRINSDVYSAGTATNWTYPAVWVDGSSNWSVRAVDNAGNLGSWSIVRSLIVDTSAPPAPVAVLPVNAKLTNDNTPSFLWNKVTDASGILRYDVRINNTVYNAGAGTNWTYPSAWVDGTSNWQVRAVDNTANAGAWSAARTLSVDATPSTPPGPVEPNNGALTNDSTPTFLWNRSIDAGGILRYEVLINATVYNAGTATNWTYPSAWVDGSSNWQIRALDNAKNVSLSPIRSLTVDATLPPTPALIFPAGGLVTNDNTPSFLWSHVTDAGGILRYEIRINNTIYDAASATNWTYGPGLCVDGTSNWQVRAVDTAVNASAWSAARSVTIDRTGPVTVGLALPSDNAILPSNSTILSWNATSDLSSVVSGYIVQLSSDPAFSAPVTRITNGLSWAVTGLVNGATNWWRVRAWDGLANTNAWSAVRRFSVDTNQLIAGLLSPANGSFTNDTTPTCAWNAVAGAGHYWLEIRTNNVSGRVVASNTNVSLTSHTFGAGLNNGQFVWRVRVFKTATLLWQAWSGVYAFSIDTAAPAAPAGLLPAAGRETNDTTPSFEWGRVIDTSGILRYEIRINNSVYNAGSGTNWTYGPGTCVDGASNWQVRAVDNADNAGAWTAVRAVVIDTTGPSAPVLVRPLDAKVTNIASPVFRWNKSADANGIARYEISVNGTIYSAGTSTNWTYPTSWVDGASNWQVRAVDTAANTGSWSAARSLTVDRTGPSGVSLVSPVSNSVLAGTGGTLAWAATSDAYSAVAGYVIQRASNPSFSPAVTKVTNGLAWPVSGLANGATNWWRVRAFDGLNNTNAWSAAWTFSVDTNQLMAALTAPAANAWTNDNTPAFSWSSVAGASRYWIEIRTNGLAGRVVASNTNIAGTAFTPGSGLNDGRYVWRVRVFKTATLLWQTWGTAEVLNVDTIAPAAASAVLPAAGKITNDSTPAFLWTKTTDSGGVLRYEVMINATVYDAGSLTNWTYGPGACVDGSSNWQVRAVDNAHNQGAWSAVRSVTLDTLAPAPPVRSLPSSNASTKDNTPLFVWGASADASGILRYELSVDGTVSNTPLVAFTWPVLPDGNRAWRVRAVDNAGNTGPWNTNWPLLVDTAPPAAVSLSSPGSNTVSVSTQVIFVWKTSADSGVGTAGYIVQYDDNPGFASPVTTVSFATDLPAVSFVNKTTNWWRVKAFDGLNDTNAWSAVWNVVVDRNQIKPVIVSPTNNAVFLTNVVPIVWKDESANGAAAYRVAVRRTSGSATVYSNSAIYATNVFVSLANGDYTVQVQASNSSTGTWQVWSDPAAFRVTVTSVSISAGDTADSLAGPSPVREGDDLHFVKLPARAIIRIYTATGRFVTELIESDGDGKYDWDLAVDGAPVSSGVYLFRIENADDPKDFKILKIGVVR